MRGRRGLFIAGGIAVVLFLIVLSLVFRTIPQPIIEIRGETLWEVGPLPIRNTLLTSWCIVAFIVVLAWFSGRNLKWLPGGWQNFIETVVEAIRGLVVNTAGEKHAPRFFWVIATFFIYIVVSNWFSLVPIFNTIGRVEEVTPEEFHPKAVIVQKASGISYLNLGTEQVEFEVDDSACQGTSGDERQSCVEDARAAAIAEAREKNNLSENEQIAVLIPFFRGVNTDLMSTLSLAIVSMVFVEYWGVSTLGFVPYLGKFFNFGALRRGPMGIIDFFVGLLELIAELARLISFSFRLFGNLLAGEILLLVMTFLLPFAFFVISIFYGLEIFVGAIQAFVFGMLTLVFGIVAVSGHGEEHAEEPH